MCPAADEDVLPMTNTHYIFLSLCVCMYLYICVYVYVCSSAQDVVEKSDDARLLLDIQVHVLCHSPAVYLLSCKVKNSSSLFVF